MNDDIPLADGITRAALYERARSIDLPGRSRMSKAELAAALTRHDGAGAPDEGVANVAEPAATTVPHPLSLLPPRLSSGHDRRLHVRRTLLEDPAIRDAGQADDAGIGAVFSALSDSPLAFFRGTPLLFERDRTDGRTGTGMPVVAASGIRLPGIEGVSGAGAAPFTRDLERTTTAFLLAAEDIGAMSAKKARKIARWFLRGYLHTVQRSAAGGDGPKASNKRTAAKKRDAVELETLDGKGWKRHAERSGRTLAREHLHSQAADPGTGTGIASRIVAAIGPHRLFIDDTLHVAQEALVRVRGDHARFLRDRELGAFERAEHTSR